MRIAFSWDDGAKEDLKLFELHRKYEIPGIFFVPTKNQEGREVLDAKEIARNRDDMICFGCHTENHVFLKGLSKDLIEKELLLNKGYLEDTLGEQVCHFCLPGGSYDANVIRVAFKYFNTVRTADTMNFMRKGQLCKPTFHFYNRGNASLLFNSIKNGCYRQATWIAKHYSMSYFDLVYRMITIESRTNDDIIIWGHSWEIEKYNLWRYVENIMKGIADNYKHLVVSYDGLFI